MNVIANLTDRIEAFRATNKNPCKNYSTQDAADKAAQKMALMVAQHHSKYQNIDVVPARYFVFYIEAWGRWVAAIDLTELLNRPTMTGGYIGLCGSKGFFCY